MTLRRNPWSVLGIDATDEQKAIKRAYAARLKARRPEDDAEAFQELRAAYEWALSQAGSGYAVPEVPPPVQQAEAAPMTVAFADSATSVPRPATPLAAPVVSETLQPEQRIEAGQEVIELDAPTARVPVTAPPEPVIDFAAQAAALWASFVQHASVQPNIKLANLLASDALHNFSLREQLEIHAAAYCASDACDETLRHHVVVKFGWMEDCNHLLRLGRREVLVAMARHHSDNAYREMTKLANSNLAVRHLLKDRPPRFSIQTLDQGFMKEMRKHLDLIHSQCPALLDYRLNGDVVAYWVKQVERKKYFLQTAVLSFAGGCILWLLVLGLAAGFLGIDSKEIGLPAFLLSQLLAIGGTAFMVLRPPQVLLRAGENFRHRIWFPYQEKRRSSRWLQFGWMPALALLATATLVPQIVEHGQLPLTVALAACAFLAWESISFDVQRKLGAFASLAFFSGILALGMYNTSFANLGFAGCFAIAFCIFLQGIRGPGQWLHMLNVQESTLRNLRAAWLLAAAGVYALCLWPVIPGLLASELVFFCVLSGLALTQIVFEKPELLGVLFLTFAAGWASETYHPVQEPHFRFLTICMSIIFAFMCASVLRSAHANKIKH